MRTCSVCDLPRSAHCQMRSYGKSTMKVTTTTTAQISMFDEVNLSNTANR